MLKTYQFKTQCKGDIHSSYISGHVLLHSINWLAKRKTLNDFTVYLRNMISYLQ